MGRARKAVAPKRLEDEVGDSERPTKKTKVDPDLQNAAESATAKSAPEPKKKGRGKAKEQPRPADYPTRVDSAWKLGAHISAAGGVENAVVNAAAIGANAFALFLKSQRKWTSPAMKEETVIAFKERLKEFGYEPRNVLPHGSYLINLGNPDKEKRLKSYECFLDDLQRCEQLGLDLYNFHPGSTVGSGKIAESLSLIAGCINDAHKSTSTVIAVIENMAGAGNVIGCDFDQLAGIIKDVENKERVGVCLDTCHLFASGYDIRTKEGWDETMTKFDEIVGLKYLRGMHINDSKTPLNSKRDRHENIGMGHIGLETFQHILRDPRVHGLPLVLETPSFEKPAVWAAEIGALNRLATLDDGLASEGAKALEEIRAAVKDAGGGTGTDTNAKEAKKPKATKRKRVAKKAESEEEEDESD